MSEFPPVPTTNDELMIAALRHANDVSGLLNDLTIEVGRIFGDGPEGVKQHAM